jgi:hypothetical protein
MSYCERPIRATLADTNQPDKATANTRHFALLEVLIEQS